MIFGPVLEMADRRGRQTYVPLWLTSSNLVRSTFSGGVNLTDKARGVNLGALVAWGFESPPLHLSCQGAKCLKSI